MATKTVETNDPHTTIIETRGGGGGAGVGIVVALLLVIALAVGAYFLMQNNRNETIRTRAVADAAGSVSDAAGSVAGAANRAADNMTPSAPAPAPNGQ